MSEANTSISSDCEIEVILAIAGFPCAAGNVFTQEALKLAAEKEPTHLTYNEVTKTLTFKGSVADIPKISKVARQLGEQDGNPR